MYNAKVIADFLEKVNNEAEQAAQAVYDKHQPAFIKLVQNQLKPGDTIDIGMGTATINRENINDSFTDSIAAIQWTEQRAGFTVWEITKA